MFWDTVGQSISSKKISLQSDRVTFTYKPFPIPTCWGVLERKAYLSPMERCRREEEVTRCLYEAGLNVTQVLEADHRIPSLTLERRNWRTLVQIFRDPSIPYKDKLQDVREALSLLHGIHDLKQCHGDSYLKNLGRMEGSEEVGTWDFECRRRAPNAQLEQVIDILILTADAMSVLKEHPHARGEDVLGMVQEVYPDIPGFPFDPRDRFFYRMRFGMGRSFFEYFQEE